MLQMVWSSAPKKPQLHRKNSHEMDTRERPTKGYLAENSKSIQYSWGMIQRHVADQEKWTESVTVMQGHKVFWTVIV